MAMSTSSMNNDTRGWIMCIVSGIACIAGASIICVDVLVRYIPSKRNFRIENSGAFLASSMSLSFGVMIFSALYSILPSSKRYLIGSGFSKSNAAWILLAGFVAGFFGIQIVSRFAHHYMPSHEVNCDHSHNETAHEHHDHGGEDLHASVQKHPHPAHTRAEETNGNGKACEATPLLHSVPSSERLAPHETLGGDGTYSRKQSEARRPSMIEVQKRVMSFVKDTKTDCDSQGPCFGYSDPCGQECYKQIGSRTPNRSRHPTILRSNTGNFYQPIHSHAGLSEGPSRSRSRSRARSSLRRIPSADDITEECEQMDEGCSSDAEEDIEAQHHHHVPENAYLSIGLQTSIAIALHKLPEGFITYATNHANPSLGFSVFMALFVHNITEGFALALPLYLALQSKPKAMLWASIFGGISQPLGAGIAAAWFKIAGHEGHVPGSTAYGIMFAITGGIMTSVALLLFVEGLDMNHNRNLCVAFAFIGMAIMGMSNALTS